MFFIITFITSIPALYMFQPADQRSSDESQHGHALQQDATGADAGTIGVALAAIKDRTFPLGPGFVVGVAAVGD